jgi:hypothetical protein
MFLPDRPTVRGRVGPSDAIRKYSNGGMINRVPEDVIVRRVIGGDVDQKVFEPPKFKIPKITMPKPPKFTTRPVRPVRPLMK